MCFFKTTSKSYTFNRKEGQWNFFHKEKEWKIWVICEGHLSSAVVDLGVVYSS